MSEDSPQQSVTPDPQADVPPDHGTEVTNAANEEPGPAERHLTWRAVLVAVVLSGLGVFLACYYEGNMLHRNMLSQNYAAPMNMGLLFLFLLLVNSIWSAITPKRSLNNGEIGVILALMLMAAPFARYYAHNWVGTVGYTNALLENRDKTVKDLVNTNVYKTLPDSAMLDLDRSREFEGTLRDESGSASPSGELVNPSRIPWSAWIKPMLFWAPLMLSFMVMSIALGYVLYRQWAHRELVTYPVAQFMADMVRKTSTRMFPDIFYNHLFWIGVGLMVFIFGCNALHGHFDKMIEVPTRYAYYNLANTFEFLKFSQEGYTLLRGTLYFTIIAAAVLLPSEISFTTWFTWPLMITGTYFYYVQTGERFQHHHASMVTSGAWWAMAILIVASGRFFFWSLIKRSIGLKSGEEVDSQSVWMFRIFAIAMIIFMAVMIQWGVPLDLAFLYMIGVMVMLLVLTRLVTEMGVIWTPLSGGGAGPLAFMLLVFGQKALGAKIFALLSIIREMTVPANVSILSLPPAVGNAAAAEYRLTKRNDSAKIVFPFLVVVLLIAFGSLIWLGYSHEGTHDDTHTALGIRMIKGNAKRISGMIAEEAGGKLSVDERVAALRADVPFAERWSNVQVEQGFVGFFLVGFVLVLGTGALRVKFPRFPLHPLPFVLFGSWLMGRYWQSFFIGWLIKKALLKIGGGKLFERSRPFFTGIVVGQVAVAIVIVLVNIWLFHENNYDLKREWYRFMGNMYSQ